jgi:hypothetical protein
VRTHADIANAFISLVGSGIFVRGWYVVRWVINRPHF